MLPQSYQTIFRKHLSEQQYLTLEILLLLIQAHRQVKLSKLASLFPQPITYQSRKRKKKCKVMEFKASKSLYFYGKSGGEFGNQSP